MCGSFDKALQDSMYLEKVETNLLFAGWSWRYGKFMAWRYQYAGGQEACYQRRREFSVGPGDVKAAAVFVGDVSREARDLFLASRSSDQEVTDGLDMEPFEILRDMLRTRRFESIGGAPQS